MKNSFGGSILTARCGRNVLFPVAGIAFSCLLVAPANAQQKTNPPTSDTPPPVGTVVVPFSGAPPAPTSTPLSRSNDAFKKGDIATAVKEVEAALKENDKQPDVLNWYGYLLLRQNRPEDAVAPLEKAMSLGAESPELEVNLGTALLMKPGATQDDLKRVVTLLEKATVEKPDMLEAQANLGHAYLRVGKPADAVTTYRKVLAKQPDNAVVQRMYGYALVKSGQTAEARTALKHAVELAPQDGDVWGLLGSLELQEGNREEATSALESARKYGAPNATVLSNLGLLYSQMGKYADSAAAYGDAADLAEAQTPPNLLPRINQGVALARAEKWKESADAYTKVLANDPKNYDALVNLGSAEYQQGHIKDAVLRFRQAAMQRPESGLAWANLGSAYGALGRYSDAAGAWKRAMAAEPRNRQYSANYRATLARAGQNAAVIQASKAAAKETKSAGPLQEMGHAYYRQAEQQLRADQRQAYLVKALTAFQQAAQRDPRSPSIWNDLGAVYERRGQIQNAIKSYKTALHIDAAYNPARVNLARLIGVSKLPPVPKSKAAPVTNAPKNATAPATEPAKPAKGTAPTPKGVAPSPAGAAPAGNGTVKP